MLGVAAIVIAACLLLALTGTLHRMELHSVDARFGVRGPVELREPVTIVAIDNRTFRRLPRWQDWSRTIHARMITRLRRAGARVIAYDIEFSEPSADPEADMALYEAAGAARPVVFATTQSRDGDTPIFGGTANLRRIGARAGQATLIDDPGGVIRRVPAERGGLPSLAVQTARAFLGPRVATSPPPDDAPWVDYAGPPGTVPTISFGEVLTGRFDPRAVRGRIVVVGPTASSLQDLHPTPTAGDELTSGAEIQANAIATVLRGYPLRPAPTVLMPLLIVVLGLAAPLASLWLGQARVVLVAAAVGAGFAGAVQVAFQSGVIVPLVVPLAALTLGAAGALVVSYGVEARERRRTRDLFARFVPESVVNEVVARTEGDLRLGGVSIVSTVLFSDLRGFTSFAETRPPDQVIDILNRYLTGMSDAILDHGGTLVAYMGDGIMAVFGAPLAQDDHADRAVAAAREMLDVRLPAFNAWLAEQGAPPFRMGIGLNTGAVMSGNVGSDRRLEYTVIGDTTNTAARLEAMTKGQPYQLYLSEATRRELLGPPPPLDDIGEVEVRGRAATLRVWGLPDDLPGATGRMAAGWRRDGSEPATAESRAGVVEACSKRD